MLFKLFVKSRKLVTSKDAKNIWGIVTVVAIPHISY